MRGKIRLDGRKNSLTKKGYPIVIYLTKDSQQKSIQTGHHSKKAHWDKDKGLPNRKHPQFLEVLNYIEIKRLRLNAFLAREYNPTFSSAEAYILDSDNGVFCKDALAYVDKYKLKRNYNIALRAFDKMYPDALYSSITKEAVELFKYQLLKTPVKGKPRSPNGVKSYLSSLTAIWNKLGKPDNPFSKVKIKAVKTKSKAISITDLRKVRDNNVKPHPNAKSGGEYNFYKYFMLCFYLGGIDFVDIANLTYDEIVDGRIEFARYKGGTSVLISNKIFPEAQEILDFYKVEGSNKIIPLTPDVLEKWHGNLSRNYEAMRLKLGIEKKPYSKAPRYTFVNIARDLMIDRRLIEEIVGHSAYDTHSIYESYFTNTVRDREHKRVIDAIKGQTPLKL